MEELSLCADYRDLINNSDVMHRDM